MRAIIHCTLLLLFLLIAAASFLPDRRLWGINHLAFFPVHVRVIVLLLMAVSFLPAAARTVYSFLSGMLDRIRQRQAFFNWTVVITAIISAAVFVRFRSSTLLLGDGQLVVRNYEYVSEGYSNVVMRDIRTILTDENIARGASILYFLSIRISEGIFGGSPINGIRIFNCILGGIFVFLLLSIVLRMKLSTELRIWTIFLALSSGTMQLFFGYAENYTPLMFVCFLYLTSGFAFIHGGGMRRFLASLALLLAGIFMHIQAVLLVPSFLLLTVLNATGTRRTLRLRIVTPTLAALPLIGIIAVRAFTGYGKHILPVTSTDQFPGILSPSHWVDTANELLLLLPVLPLIAVMALMIPRMNVKAHPAKSNGAEKHSRKPAPARRSPEGGLFTLDAEWHFSLLILLPALLYLFIFKAEIGMPRDWDLFTIASLGLVPLALLILNRFLCASRTHSLPLITTPALVMSALLGIAWTGINADAERSAERFERILHYDKTNEAYVHEILAKHYYRENRLDRAIPAVQTALSLSRNPRHYVMLAKYDMADGRTKDAIEVLEALLSKKPESEYAEWARSTLVTLLDETDQYGKLLAVAREGTLNHPDEPIYHYFYGKMLLAQGKFREGVDELLECRRLGPPPPVLQEIDAVIEQLESEGKI